jgi:hypothetical protein
MNYIAPKSRVTAFNRRQRYECYATNDGVYVPFSEMIGRPLPAYDHISLQSKRMFINNREMIAWTLSRVFSHRSNDAILEYLHVLVNIRTNTVSYTLEHLLRDLFVGCPEANTPPVLSPSVIGIIDEIQSSIYVAGLDDMSLKENNINEELQITDRQALELLKIAMACRYISPLLCEFLNITDEDSDLVLYKGFIQVYEVMTPPDLNLIGKLMKFIEGRILKTLRSDQGSWIFHRNYGRDKNTEIIEILASLICEVIPKLEGRVLGFLHSTVERKIMHFFHTKENLKILPMVMWNVQDRPEGFDTFDRHMASQDGNVPELFRIVDRLCIDNMLTQLRESFGEISREKYSYYEKFDLSRSQLSRKLLFIFYGKQLGDYNSLYQLNSRQYYQFLIYLVDWLTRQNILLSIRDLLIAIPTGEPADNQSRISQRLSSSSGYRSVIQNQYPYVRQQMMHGYIVGELLEMMSQKFWRVPLYEEWLDIVNRGAAPYYEWQVLEFTPEQSCNEFLYLVQM